MSDIRIKVTRRMKIKDMVALESGKITPFRDLLAEFMVDASGKPMKKAEAIAILDELDDLQLAEVGKQFSESLNAFALPTIGDVP